MFDGDNRVVDALLLRSIKTQQKLSELAAEGGASEGEKVAKEL